MTRIVQVGLGGWGRNWAQTVIPHVLGVEVVARADVSEASRQAALQEGITGPDSCFATAEEAIAATDPDAVLVTASLDGHVAAVRAGLSAGKHVLVEKPFAPSVADGRELADLADRHGVILAVSQNYRFHPAVRAVVDFLRAGELGQPHAVELDFRKMSGADGKRIPHHELEEPLLVDMSIHHFDLLRTVLGRDPVEISCRAWDPDWSLFTGPSEGVALIDFGDDLVASYRGSWVSNGTPTAWAGTWRMDFADGEVAWSSRSDDEEEWIVVRTGRGERELDLPATQLTDRAGSLHEFVSAIDQGRQPEVTGRDNLTTLALTYAAVESSHSGKPVTVTG